jgi:hypothetical protein
LAFYPFAFAGKRTVNTEPFPGSLATVTSPPTSETANSTKWLPLLTLRAVSFYFFVMRAPVAKHVGAREVPAAAVLMRINIWIVLVVLVALFAVTRLSRYQHNTQRICADDPSASVCAR